LEPGSTTPADQVGFAPENRTTLPQRSVSSAISLPKSAGLPGNGVAPSSTNLALISGSAIGRAVDIRAVRLEPNDRIVLTEAAFALGHLNSDLSTAIPWLDRAISLKPNSALAFGRGAIVGNFAGDYETAEENSERALRLSPYDTVIHASAHPHPASALAHIGALDEARGSIKQLLQLRPMRVRGWPGFPTDPLNGAPFGVAERPGLRRIVFDTITHCRGAVWRFHY